MLGSSTAILLCFATLAVGCGGGAALLHPAHVLHPGDVALAAGLSATAVPEEPAETPSEHDLRELSLLPSLSPWASGRIGFSGSNEASLTYTGQAVRLGGRHEFRVLGSSISAELGASAMYPARANDEGRAFGAGFDVPILFGARSRADLYAFWMGPRFAFSHLEGTFRDQPFDANHSSIGLTVGGQAGFRHLHGALELTGSYDVVRGAIFGAEAEFAGFVLVPAAALVASF